MSKLKLLGLASIVVILIGENYFAELNHQVIVPLFISFLFVYWGASLTKKGGDDMAEEEFLDEEEKSEEETEKKD